MFQRRPGFNHSKALRPTENRFCEEIHHRQSYFVRGRGVFTGQKSFVCMHVACVAPFVLSGVARRRTARDAARQPKRDIVVPLHILYSQRHNIASYIEANHGRTLPTYKCIERRIKNQIYFFPLFYLLKKETTKNI